MSPQLLRRPYLAATTVAACWSCCYCRCLLQQHAQVWHTKQHVMAVAAAAVLCAVGPCLATEGHPGRTAAAGPLPASDHSSQTLYQMQDCQPPPAHTGPYSCSPCTHPCQAPLCADHRPADLHRPAASCHDTGLCTPCTLHLLLHLQLLATKPCCCQRRCLQTLLGHGGGGGCCLRGGSLLHLLGWRQPLLQQQL